MRVCFLYVGKWAKKSLLHCLKVLIELDGKEWNHARAMPHRVTRKTLHFMVSLAL